ncbi:MAG TPA: hypothetical protein VK472_05545 [Allosphingosinicella sp.]|nr:hypothetical protein [Allosphingosinicella sp.]
MHWPVPLAAVVALWGCSLAPGPLTRAEVCAVAGSYFNTPPLNNAEAWDWPAKAQEVIEAHRWTEAGEALVKGCTSATIPVVGLSMSEGRDLALITRSSYPLVQTPGLEPIEVGSIDTCLLRRDGGSWNLVACKLDAVS